MNSRQVDIRREAAMDARRDGIELYDSRDGGARDPGSD